MYIYLLCYLVCISRLLVWIVGYALDVCSYCRSSAFLFPFTFAVHT